MLYIPKIADYLKILTDEEVKGFVAKNFNKCFKPIWEEQNLRKVAKSLFIFLTKPNVVKNMCNQILLMIIYITIMLRF